MLVKMGQALREHLDYLYLTPFPGRVTSTPNYRITELANYRIMPKEIDSQPHWYVADVNQKFEKKLIAILARDGIECFTPVQKTIDISGRNPRPSPLLFPQDLSIFIARKAGAVLSSKADPLSVTLSAMAPAALKS